MFKPRKFLSKSLLIITGTLMLGAAGYTAADESYGNDDSGHKVQDFSNRAAPLGYKKYIIIMGNGAYKSPDGTRFLNGLEGGDGLKFQRQSMHRSAREIARVEQEAKDFFLKKFGIYAGVDERVMFTGFQIDPRNNMRAYSVSDENTPLSGWEVESGGWQMTVVSPDGLMLGGEFASRNIHVDQGTFFLFGDLKIDRSGDEDDNKHQSPIIIRYKTSNPFKDNNNGGLILLDLESAEWGEGADGGSIVNTIDEDGLLHSRLRSVITFPPLPKTN